MRCGSSSTTTTCPCSASSAIRPSSMSTTGDYDVNGAGDQSWDIGPDGRFLMMRPVQTKRIDVRVALHWIADVRGRLDRAQ